MSRGSAVKPYINFVKGLNTQAGLLNYPEGYCTDMLNVEVTQKGSIKSRLGIDYETGYTLQGSFTETDINESAITEHSWRSVAEVGDLNFEVLQVGRYLYFYDASSSHLSDGLKSFTVDLNSFAAASATEIHKHPIQAESGKGYLFVVGLKIDPFYVSYDVGTDSIVATASPLQVRDLIGIDDGLDIDEEPVSLTAAHQYNLYNQGWKSYEMNQYATVKGVWPGNNKLWWVGKALPLGGTYEVFDPNQYSNFHVAASACPKGVYIVNPFRIDRSSVSGIAGLDVVTVDRRPTSVAFFGGRAWYAGADDKVYFTQLILSDQNIGKCYQLQDPTSEDGGDLLATDGGYIVIPEAGVEKTLFRTSKGLLVMSSNGVWLITGLTSDSGFTATDYSVTQISSDGITSATSLVDVSGSPVWCSETGVFTLSSDNTGLKNTVKNISFDIINDFYQDIPEVSKKYIKGVYDKYRRIVQFFYASEAPSGDTLRYKYDSILCFDLSLNAFYPLKISSISSESPWISGAVVTSKLNNTTTTAVVTDASGAVVTDGGDPVTVDVLELTSNPTYLKYLTFVPDGSSYKYTFSDFTNLEYVDWKTADNTGEEFERYFLTGYEINQDTMRQKQAMWIETYMKTTEELIGLEYVNYSELYMQARWDWYTESSQNKFSIPVKCYRSSLRPIAIVRHKIRGTGRALQLKFYGETGKAFELLGWTTVFAGNTIP